MLINQIIKIKKIIKIPPDQGGIGPNIPDLFPNCHFFNNHFVVRWDIDNFDHIINGDQRLRLRLLMMLAMLQDFLIGCLGRCFQGHLGPVLCLNNHMMCIGFDNFPGSGLCTGRKPQGQSAQRHRIKQIFFSFFPPLLSNEQTLHGVSPGCYPVIFRLY